MLNQNIDELLTDVGALESQRLEQFEQMARRLHAGEACEPHYVAQVLRGAGKDKEHLRTRLALFAERDQQRQDLAECDGLRTRLAELQGEVEQANAWLEDRVAEHRDRCRPLQREIAETRERLQQAKGHRDALYESCDDPDLTCQLRIVQSRMRDLVRPMRDAKSRAADYWADGQYPETVWSAEQRAAWDRQRQRALARVAELEAELAGLKQQQADIEEQMRLW